MNRTRSSLRRLLQLDRLPGDVMFDRAMLALVFAVIVAVMHVFLLLNIYFQPRLTMAALLIDLPAIVALWVRGISALVSGWRDPSARVLRFSSIGALLLMFWPVGMLLTVSLMPLESD